ncbi:MAG TPA: hypothetical protein VJ729_11780 [Nitrososphaeraceae archaeon]|nr:hypothetical protein [Nitrososphaeraceae archaeon]
MIKYHRDNQEVVVEDEILGTTRYKLDNNVKIKKEMLYLLL